MTTQEAPSAPKELSFQQEVPPPEYSGKVIPPEFETYVKKCNNQIKEFEEQLKQSQCTGETKSDDVVHNIALAKISKNYPVKFKWNFRDFDCCDVQCCITKNRSYVWCLEKCLFSWRKNYCWCCHWDKSDRDKCLSETFCCPCLCFIGCVSTRINNCRVSSAEKLTPCDDCIKYSFLIEQNNPKNSEIIKQLMK